MIVHVVCGALVSDGQVLLGHRSPARRWFPDVWDLPGGHVEHGESSRTALERELSEELGVAVRTADALQELRLRSAAGADELRMDVWRVRAWVGTPVNKAPEEHDELRWFPVDQLPIADLAHPSYAELLSRLVALPADHA